MVRENVHGLVRRLRGASVKDSETSPETCEFSNLICGSEQVAIIDADKPRVSLVNFVSDNGVFVLKDECHKKSTDATTSAQDPGFEDRHPKGRNRECFRKKMILIFERLPSDTWSLRNCDVSLMILQLPILLMCVVVWIFLQNQQKARNMCKPLINCVIKKRRNWFLLVHHGQLGR